ncbi:hypothetical protein GQX73_g9895 [Xylaria multiplex]|uniref:Cross-pathway control protein 1 n=1 Tax=Xylaria multiplex TaxID=323545 RepID=A0A7C8MKQ6_9PEZI|nr:hypothetical protein GQX73_g9895 [Xylaria multiplex]
MGIQLNSVAQKKRSDAAHHEPFSLKQISVLAMGVSVLGTGSTPTHADNLPSLDIHSALPTEPRKKSHCGAVIGQSLAFASWVTTSALPSQVDLNFEEAIPSSRASSQPTATILPQDFSVFTTDSTQSSWLPSSSPRQPAPSAQQHSFQSPPQQDFVLFDSPQPQRTIVNRTASSPAVQAAAAFGSLNTTNSSTNRSDSSTSPALQNQRVQQIIQASGHQFSPSALTNRLNSPAQNQSQQQQFYASLSTSPSAAAVNQQSRLARPPVPLFLQGIGSQRPPAKMDLQGDYSPVPLHRDNPGLPKLDAMNNLEGFTAFGGGTSTAFSSPAINGCDLDMSSASSSANLGTVSPGELLINEQFSAPHSAAFTNLTTPSTFGESPEFEQFEVSPNFGDLDAGSAENWYSLFPDESLITNQANASVKSPLEVPAELEITETDSLPRRKSGHSPPMSNNHARHSSVSGVNSRRRDKPLPPIIIDDPSDTVAMKRARNTLAARKSRERKAQKLEELEEKIAKLEEERDHWKRLALSRPSGA